jgi:hypothetical protein
MLTQGPPSSPLSLIQELMNVKWNSVDIADNYTVSVSPPIESKSVFFTSNTTIQLHFLYNQDYNVSVLANNCAGSSIVSADVNIRIGKLIGLKNFHGIHACILINTIARLRAYIIITSESPKSTMSF